MTDVQCFEVCVYCRVSFSNASDFLEHKCHRKHDVAKDYFMKERQSQLRQYVVDKLSQMDPTLPKPQERKGREEMTGFCSVMRLKKKRKLSLDHNEKEHGPQKTQSRDSVTSTDTDDFAPSTEAYKLLRNNAITLATPAASTCADTFDVEGATQLTSSLPNQFGLSNSSSARKVAPMFRNVTITPNYFTEQQVSGFQSTSATALDKDFSGVSLGGLESSNYVRSQQERYLHSIVAEGYSDERFYMSGVPETMPARKTAPMFHNVTITPTYDSRLETQFEHVPPHTMVPEITELLRVPFEGAETLHGTEMGGEGAEIQGFPDVLFY